jgi:hypothetical protein
MKHSFRSLTRLASIAALCATLSHALLEARGQGTGDGGHGSGQQLVAEAAKRIVNEPAIGADLRYRVNAFGHALVGNGAYYQLAAGPEKLLRLDLRMQVGEHQATIQEIRGAGAYWIRRHVPPAPPMLGRVDLKQLHRSLAQATTPGGREVMPQEDWILQGGLARLLAALEQNFRFDPPQADELQFSAADGQSVVSLPIWNMSGVWKPERLAALAGKDAKKGNQLPEQLPDRVELVLGRTDDVLPLFPYRITYWRNGSQATKDIPASQPHELLTLELYNVSQRAIDPREFDYQPGDQEVENLTQSYVQRLSPSSKLR